LDRRKKDWVAEDGRWKQGHGKVESKGRFPLSHRPGGGGTILLAGDGYHRLLLVYGLPSFDFTLQNTLGL
jgi:hypothetical protein